MYRVGNGRLRSGSSDYLSTGQNRQRRQVKTSMWRLVLRTQDHHITGVSEHVLLLFLALVTASHQPVPYLYLPITATVSPLRMHHQRSESQPHDDLAFIKFENPSYPSSINRIPSPPYFLTMLACLLTSLYEKLGGTSPKFFGA
ncbi:hypothetical protein DL95DRAFT_455911 [Leptodontidium sp. 2 PMI_412]|nr:hypothetical protein DL95DRAFT_455911 [Leptodontidium sp. 2 PMI_412]